MTLPTVGDYREKMIVRATCNACRHSAPLDLAALAEKHGPDTTLVAIRDSMVCSKCDGRSVTLTVTSRKMEGIDPR